MAAFKIPGPDKRVTVVGRTGSGKTQGGAFLLSQSNFADMPYVVLDFKREKMFAEFGARTLTLRSDGKEYRELNQPGIFIARPTLDELDEVESLLWQIWDHENVGIFVDEGYMIGKSRAFIACLTQGRSKNIPMIVLTQRPRFITGFAFSEADFLMIFRLSKPEDRKTVQDYVDGDISKRLPEHWSYWYDVTRDALTILRPVPSREWIVREIKAKLSILEDRTTAKTFV